MPVLSISQVITRARLHEFTDDEMPELCAVVMTESGGKTDAKQLRGKGRGLVQIDLGQHPDVTEAEAFDPDFALDFARRLSRNAHGFGPPNWYGPDDHPEIAAQARTDARRVLEEETPMDLWHPDAERVQPADGHTGLALDGVPWKIVLHTTETTAYSPSTASYFGNPYWPHATITADGIYQHLPINVGGYALYSDGSVSTNHANAIQCEIVWYAANGDWPDALLAQVASWVRWVQAQTSVPSTFAEMFREGVTVASVSSPLRFGRQEWLDFHGICGHSNVPGGNDHWDPGRLPVDRLRALLDPTPSPPIPKPQEAEVALVIIAVHPGENVSVPLPQQGNAFGWSSVAVTLTAGPGEAKVRAVIGPDWHGLDPDHPEDLVIPPEGRVFSELGATSNVLQVANLSAKQTVGVMVEAK